MIETSWPKRRRAWIRLSGSAPTCCGSRRGAPTGEPTNIGSVRRNSTLSSALMLYGNRRGIRKGGLTNTWIGRVNLRGLSRWRRLIRIFRRIQAQRSSAEALGTCAPGRYRGHLQNRAASETSAKRRSSGADCLQFGGSSRCHTAWSAGESEAQN